MTKQNLFRGFGTSPEIIRLAVIDVNPLSTVASERRRPAARARDRCQLRDDPILVAPVPAHVCGDAPKSADRRGALQPLVMASRRGVREEQRREPLSLAGCARVEKSSEFDTRRFCSR